MTVLSPKLKIYCHDKCKVDNAQCKDCEELEKDFFKYKLNMRKNASRYNIDLDEYQLVSAYAELLQRKNVCGKVFAYE